ncbi:helix-turn-helix domain-containing protein [Nocardiopsis lucentensis]
MAEHRELTVSALAERVGVDAAEAARVVSALTRHHLVVAR